MKESFDENRTFLPKIEVQVGSSEQQQSSTSEGTASNSSIFPQSLSNVDINHLMIFEEFVQEFEEFLHHFVYGYNQMSWDLLDPDLEGFLIISKKLIDDELSFIYSDVMRQR